jgi:hypothetical protein
MAFRLTTKSQRAAAITVAAVIAVLSLASTVRASATPTAEEYPTSGRTAFTVYSFSGNGLHGPGGGVFSAVVQLPQ